jgi:NYN domain
MTTEIVPLRAIAFFDGQNLFQHAKAAFGHHHPNFDPLKLHALVCAQKGWSPKSVRFYTGIPNAENNQMWAGYWAARILSMKRSGITTITRPLRYRTNTAYDENGNLKPIIVAQEKGIDVRLALDVVSLAVNRSLDVAVLFSQDQDLAELAPEIRAIANLQQRNIIIASAYPCGPNATASRGVNKTEWIKITEDQYNQCLDPRDYRPAKS